MISLENVSLIFDEGGVDEIKALKNINFSISQGDFITLIGSNGSGKSSLFNVISGIHFPDKGVIKQDSRDITRWPEYRRASFIGRVFQNPHLGTVSRMSVQDNLTIASYKGMKKIRISLNKARKEEFRRMLARLGMGLENRMTDNVGQLSGGQRQAMTMLMAVQSSPSLLLLDEHTAALDPRNAARVMKFTEDFYHEFNLTVMMVTHNMDMAIQSGNRLIMMDRGEIILEFSGREKSNLTVSKLIQNFHDIRGSNLSSDESLLN